MNTIIRRTARLRAAGPHGLGRGNRILRRWSITQTPGVVLHCAARLLDGYSDTDDVNPWTNLANPDNSPSVGTTWRATYTANAINGLPALTFNPAAPDFYVGFSVTLPTFSIYVVQQTAGDCILLGREDANVQVRIGEGGSNVLTLYQDATGVRTSGTLSTARTAWSLIEYFYDGAAVSFRENGQPLSGAGTFAALTLNEISGIVQGTAPVNGQIAEIVIASSLSNAARDAIEDDLITRYALGGA